MLKALLKKLYPNKYNLTAILRKKINANRDKKLIANTSNYIYFTDRKKKKVFTLKLKSE